MARRGKAGAACRRMLSEQLESRQLLASDVFINEFHYDNSGPSDINEFVEVAGPAGTDLSGWSISAYNGSNGTEYSSTPLTGVIDDEGNGGGALAFVYPTNGLQNGAPDALALVNPMGAVVQFISYEGVLMGVGGPADGLTSIDVGVFETNSTSPGESLQLTGSGSQDVDFTWTGPVAESPGSLNAGQTYGGMGPALPDMYISELLFNPPGNAPGSQDEPNEYIELRGTPGATIPGGTYLVDIEGDLSTGATIGDVTSIFDLSGLTFGSNGYLVLLQGSSPYDAAGATAAGANVLTSTSAGFAGLLGGIYTSDTVPGGFQTGLENASNSILLIRSAVPPQLFGANSDADSDDDGVLDNADWTIVDGVSVLDNDPGDAGYAPVVFTQQSGMAVAEYVGRIGESTGQTTADWVAGALAGTAPNWTLETGNTTPASFAGEALDHLGSFNFPAPVVTGDFVFNEFRISTPGATDDDSNFIELVEINGANGVSTDGLTIIALQGELFTTANGQTQVPSQIVGVFSLDGGSSDENGFMLLSGSGLGNVSFDSGDLNSGGFDPPGAPWTFLLVSGFTGANGNVLDPGGDGTLDITPWTAVLDAVSLDDSSNNAVQYAPGLGGVTVLSIDTFTPAAIARVPDQTGAFVLREFADASPDTPGRTNVPRVVITQTDGSTSVTEGFATDTVSVVLTSAPTSDVTVTLTPANGEISLSTTTLMFTPGNFATPQTVTVTAVDDEVQDGIHSSAIAFTTTSTDAVFNAAELVDVPVTIIDNDATPAVIATVNGRLLEKRTIDIDGIIGITSGTVEFSLASPPTSPVTMTITPDSQITANDGTAPIVLTFDSTNWLVPQAITVAAVDDTVDEGDHDGLLTVTLAGGGPDYDALAVNPVAVPIVDDDNANHVVVINEILYDPRGNAPGETTGGYDANGDGVVDAGQDEFVEILNTSSQPVEIGNWVINDSTGTRYTFTPGLTLAAGQAIVVFGGGSVANGLATGLFGNSLAVVSNGLQLGNGGDTVTLFDGTRTVDTHTYVNTATGGGPNTSLARDSDEVFIPVGSGPFLLSSEFTATNPDTGLPFEATPGRTNFDNTPFPIGASVTVVQTDDSTVVTEGGTPDAFTFALASAPSATVNVAISTAAGQVTVGPTSLTFTTANWDTPQTITVTAVDDSIEEFVTTDVISFALTSTDADYNGLTVSDVSVTVLDDDVVVTTTAAINEARYVGAVDFVELTGDPGASFAGLTLVVLSNEFEPGQIDSILDLSTGVADENGFLLIAQSDITASVDPGDIVFGGFNLFGFTNQSPQTLLIVSGYTGPTSGDLDADNNGVLDSTPWTAVLDSVATTDTDTQPDFPYSTVVVPGGPNAIARDVDTTGTFVATANPVDDTPGFSNSTLVVSIDGTSDGIEAGEVAGVFTVTISEASTVDTVISYTVGGTATAGTDFTAPSGTVTILANETTATISIPVIDDTDPDAGETIEITLDTITSSAAGVTLGGTGVASIGIIDDDTPLPTLFINELDADQAGTDSAEFVEIYDGGVGNTSLNGVSLVFFNGSNDLSYDSYDLSGFVTDENGFFVIGSETVANVDFSPTGFTIQNGPDAVALYFASTSAFPNGTAPTLTGLIDAVVYDSSSATDAVLAAAFGQTVQYSEFANGNGTTESLSRTPDGTGEFVAQTPTPGATNGGIVVTPAPTVVSVTINEGAAFANSRSMVTSVTIEFDSFLDAAALANAFTITNITTGQVVDTVIVTAVDGVTATTVTLTFGDGGVSVVDRAGAGLLGNSLADGNYQLDINSTNVVVSGGAVAMEEDFEFGGQLRTDADNDDFFRLYGEINGDGVRNNPDLVAILAALQTGGYRSDLDINGDGIINNPDLIAMSQTINGSSRP